MFSKSQALVFALSILSVSLGRPFDSGTHIKRVHRPATVRAQVARAQVIRAQVVPRDASASCTTCATVIVKVSGTATASASFTVTVGSAPTSTVSPSAIGNFGSCSVPQIEFGAGFDGRNETSFRPVDQVSYNHTSADNITVITDFICGALVDTCGADPAAQATCAKAQAAAAAETPQEGIDADAFNVVFGFQTNFKNVEALSDTGDPIAGSTSSSAAPSSSIAVETPASATHSTSSTAASNATVASTPVSTSSQNAATHGAGASHAPPTTLVTIAATTAEPTEPAPTSAAAGSANSNNLQFFTGALGGISAPPVVASGSQFQVEGNSLIKNKADALSRSCDVQQNDCADAANASGNKGSLTVAACHTQQDDCNAAAANGT